MVVPQKGDHVWIEHKSTPAQSSSAQSVPIGAWIKDMIKDQITVIDDDDKEYVLKPGTKIRHMHVSSLKGVDDMISLGDLNEAGILRNLLIRYRRDEIYTYTGKILVAVNPYAILPIYTTNEVKAYRNRKINELPPHIFAIADSAYNSMRRFIRNQSIIISGESGAGKTESTKLILQFLAAVSGQHSWIEQQVLDSNPILEAFGNARTIRNDNSSRFGKYIDIFFGSSGTIEGARIDQFLLEKSRIVSQMPDERNYHVFYCLFDGLSTETRARWGLTRSSDYVYLNQGGYIDLEGCTDIVNFPTLRAAMKVLTFSDEESEQIFQLLAALLHLGNLSYQAKSDRNMDSCDVVMNSESDFASNLLQVKIDDLKKAITTKNLITRDELVVTNINVNQAINVRDALVKGIYGHLFVWIVDKINKAIYRPGQESRPRSVHNHTTIGVLDIFGFENFTNNSYEQLCINYANENLQQFFVRHIFKMEQDEYGAELIDWQHIAFTDNQETLDLIGVKNCNILALIDEESRFPKGTDQSLLIKLVNGCIKHPRFVKKKAEIDQIFGIQHFAGTVFYKIEGFLEKNRDSFNMDLIELIQTSRSAFLKKLFEKDLLMGFETRKRAPTLSLQYKKSLDSLMKILMERDPFFIRCIKPNDFKRKHDFDRVICLEQLRYSGMMETIRIRKAGYPIRHQFADFIDRYRILVRGIPPSIKCKDTREVTKLICKNYLDTKAYQLGKTKLFLKDSQDALLEDALERMLFQRVVLIQKMWRKYHYRKSYLMKRAAAIRIQAFVRMKISRRRFLKAKKGFSLLQATFRAKIASRKLHDLKGFLRNVQRYCRGFLVRDRMTRRRKAIVKIQSQVRRYIAMKNYQAMMIEERKLGEALKLKMQEETLLKQQMSEEKAKQEAEKRHKARMDRIHDETLADARLHHQQNINKRQRIADAELKRDLPVSQSQMLDEMFGSIDGYNSISRASSINNGPAAFRDLEHGVMGTVRGQKPVFDSPVPDYLINILEEDVSDFTFSKFAATYFQNDIDAEFVRKPLRRPLLFHSSTNNQSSALSLWIAILRFMRDLPEPVLTNRRTSAMDSMPVMARIYQSLGRRVNREELEREFGQADHLTQITPYENSSRKNIVSLTLKKKSKFTEEVVSHLKNVGNDQQEINAISFLEERPTSNLEKLHFIIGHGILVPELRDEIYCQICKQIRNNPRRESVSRGLILLILCIGCFAPTERFVRTLRNFIMANFAEYATYLVSRLQRTFANGTRNQPPSWLELKAIKHKEPIVLTVGFMNGRSETVFADSASTAQELCLVLAQKIGLKDHFGFSLFVAIFDKVSSIGSGADHVMDAISQCEQYAKEKGFSESKAQWRLFFRKEIFTPWHNPSDCQIATDLIYQQIMRGLKFGEYLCDSDDELSRLCAYHLYIDDIMHPSNEALAKYAPQSIVNGNKERKKLFLNSINSILARLAQSRKSSSKEKLKEEIVTFARIKWPMLFSRFYEAVKFSGPSLETNNLIFTINWTGVYLVDSTERVHLELTFPEIVAVSSNRTNRLHGQSLSLATVKGDNYTFNCANSEDIRDLVIMFLEGLKERSRYLIVVQSFSKPDPSFLTCEKGDLIILDNVDDLRKLSTVDWYYGENYRTKQCGDFPSDVVYILPIISFPSTNLLALFSNINFAQPSHEESNVTNKQHSLEEFARIYFRSPITENGSFSFGGTKETTDSLWKHSPHDLKQPLLKKILNKEDLAHQAISCFHSILQYTGDQPCKDLNSSEIVDCIFGPCLKQDGLKDEIYCQLVKQVTMNPNPQSEKSGWELLWLATGIMVPSGNFHRELQELFRTASSTWAIECQARLQKTLKSGQRRYPPHSIEINSVQMGKIIRHKIYFPNESIQAFEITSSTKCKDLCMNICEKIGLKDSKGFALFVKSIDKAISMPEGDYFFDFIRQLSHWVKKHRPSKDGQLEFSYQIFFMKKLWTNTFPGLDEIADVVFHYPQEVRKYIHGYHKVHMDEAIMLGALILRAQCGDDESKIPNFIGLLDLLVPPDIRAKQTAIEIQQKIIAQYHLQGGMNENEAKLAFLKSIFQWPTFGSAFFEVNQSTNVNAPTKILIAINKHGVHLIHTKTKDIIDHYPYATISNWSSGNTYFNMTIGNLIHGEKLLCETPLGYKMDDLLTSYISLMMTSMAIHSVN